MSRDPHSSASDSDDEEEQSLHTLIPQNETKSTTLNPSAGTGPSIFEITRQSAARIGRRATLPGKKCLLLGVCLPLVLVLLFFSLDLRRVFGIGGSLPAWRVAAVGDRMREAELETLFLLRNQRLELLKYLNRTVVGNNGSDWNLSPSASPVGKMNLSEDSADEIKSALKMNVEMRDKILSAHRNGNVSDFSLENEFDLPNFESDSCKKVEKLSNRRTIDWKPKKDRFLFAICLSGQMSNHLICLEKHMFFAALLNRVLVLPSSKFDYQYDRVLDVDHINKCFDQKVIISFEQFEQQHKNKIHINKFICYMSSPPCFLDEEHLKRLKNLGLQFGSKIEPAFPDDSKSKDPINRSASDILSKFQSDEETIAVGDLFYAEVESEWVMQAGGPLKHRCQAVVQPSRLIVLTAQRFVQTFLGRDFVAVHFRRHGFLKFCNAKKEKCFFSIPESANCIKKILQKSNAPVIYLSTDAADVEINILQKLINIDGKEVPLIRRPEHISSEKWDSLLYRNHIGGDNQVEAMLDKTISALSKVFIGSSGSTFTEDIIRLRKDWGSASKCDEYLCQGQQPNFIAEDE
ncbi:hypothetical protein LUZ60_005245 [Juncus effusus]|nr:hypothetical protein LUZ60_005245 [Juncus effusus]